MKKMSIEEQKNVNGGDYYYCVCGKKYEYSWWNAFAVACVYNNHMKYYCVYGKRFLNGDDF